MSNGLSEVTNVTNDKQIMLWRNE